MTYVRNPKPRGVESHGNPWTADLDAHLLMLRERGHPYKIIGLYMGRTPQSVRLRCDRLKRLNPAASALSTGLSPQNGLKPLADTDQVRA